MYREDHLTSVKSDSEAEMDDLSDTSLECERREERTKTNSMIQLMSHIQVMHMTFHLSLLLYLSSLSLSLTLFLVLFLEPGVGNKGGEKP